MGTFGGFTPQRILQVLYSALKVPLLFLLTFLICLPSFFLVNTLLGVRGDFGRVARGLVASQAALTVILASLAPFTALWYLSSGHYRLAILFNGLMFAVAGLAAQVVLWREYRPLVARDPRHRPLAATWLVLYVFVGIQMAWVLRPYVGDPRGPVSFFREDSWSNACVFLAQMIWKLIAG
jgi:hypothetical protein